MDVNIKDFLKEDIGAGDVTTDAIVPEDHCSKAMVLVKAEGVVAGHCFAREVFRCLDRDIRYEELKPDGERVKKGDIVAAVAGKSRAILTGERVALNILQRLSGIATFTRGFVEAVEGTGVKILDTRKTSPGLRGMEKYAVRMGGGYNHRFDLSEMALIKENHIAVAGSITEAVKRVRSRSQVPLTKPKVALWLGSPPVEVEVRTMEELQEAIEAGVDRIMLDNWDIGSIKKAVALVHKRIPLEVSGNMTMEKAHEVAKTGIDFISVGALTHSFKALDMTLLQQGLRDER
ncbi:MAG: carboxylating nicotinate-nucleotide diphosphorylase [Desulfobacterales bacterium]|nr:carboxylating nicotinate-nucleotide diphosphorylase [Desulfobacterales bacterium]